MATTQRFLILAEGRLGVFSAKTATSVIRYRPNDVAAVLDSVHAGERLEEIIGVGEGIPIVSSVAGALPLKPTDLLIGIAPRGGLLPDSWRDIIRQSIESGLGIISGLHTFISEDAEFAPLAERCGVKVVDVRRPPDNIPLARNVARDTPALRVLTVGTDCAVGKMVVSIELDRAARARGLRSRFVASGQTGMMITGAGVPVDRVISDFVAGCIEQELLKYADEDVLFIEGQGSITHPAYSGVTLGLLHGSAPDGLILCHQAGRTHVGGFGDVPLLPLAEAAKLHEAITAPLYPAKVVGVALNCVRLDDGEARRACDEAAAETGLPATDVIRFGCEPLMNAVERLRAEKRPSPASG